MNKILLWSAIVVFCLLAMLLLTSRRENVHKRLPESQEYRYTITPTLTPDVTDELYKGRATGIVPVCYCSDDRTQCRTEEIESWRVPTHTKNKNNTVGKCVLSPTPEE